MPKRRPPAMAFGFAIATNRRQRGAPHGNVMVLPRSADPARRDSHRGYLALSARAHRAFKGGREMRGMSFLAVRVTVGLAFAAASVVANGAGVAASGDAVIKVSAGGYQTCALRS